ncbi:MAG: hypothetical protein ACFFDX_05250 [Candidatus Odinarchaeota archaeon]
MEKKNNKSRLTKEELKEFYEKTKNVDKKLDHGRAYRTLINPIRRNILNFIGCNIKTMEEIKNEFEFDETQIIYHLNMLKQTFYILDSEEGWKLTPRGIGFLENARLDN